MATGNVCSTTSSTQSRRSNECIPPARSGVRGIAVLVALTLALIAGVTPANAAKYNCYSGGYPSRTFNVRYVNANSTWKAHYDIARGRWNNSSAGARIGNTSNSAATIVAQSYPGLNWYGMYTPTKVLGRTTKFSIQINSYTLSRDTASSSQFATWARGTIAHELGHALRLLDNPATTSSSLMKHNRSRNTVVSPTAYDIANVKGCY